MKLRQNVATILMATLGAFLLAGLLAAQTPSPEGMPKMGGEGQGMMAGGMMEECKAMMAKHDEMMAKMKEMDQKLERLVADMNAARGAKKVDAVAAVVGELVAQRQAMHPMMQGMHAEMMDHMMRHMQEGMMQGMKHSMSGCPMMKRSASEAEGHEKHH